MIRNATIKDTKAITNIYNYYVLNDIATFAEELIPIKETEVNIKKASLRLAFFINNKSSFVK